MNGQTLRIYPATDFIAASGVAEGDAISFADELLLDDIYGLRPTAQRTELTLTSQPGGFAIAQNSHTGTPGQTIHLDCCLSFMTPGGTTAEALILVELSGQEVAGIYMLPLIGLTPKTNYRLIGVDRHAATTRFAQIAFASFGHDTRISMGDGQLRAIQNISPGDAILTRDDGIQPVRWIGHHTVRAVGAFAPVVIDAGALHNAGDLILAPDHRLFVYQRQDALGAGRPEILIKARHLVNGSTVRRRHGGFVDYYQLLFDDHQIIYAEGIAAESLLVDTRTAIGLPHSTAPHNHRDHLNYEVHKNLLSQADAAATLRKASLG